MLPTRTLLRLAYQAQKSGAHEDAVALAQLALTAEDADAFCQKVLAGGEPSAVDLEHEATSPVPKVAEEEKVSKSKQDEHASLTTLLENGEDGTAGGPPGLVQQTGYNVKGFADRLAHAMARLAQAGFPEAANEIRNCLR